MAAEACGYGDFTPRTATGPSPRPARRPTPAPRRPGCRSRSVRRTYAPRRGPPASSARWQVDRAGRVVADPRHEAVAADDQRAGRGRRARTRRCAASRRRRSRRRWWARRSPTRGSRCRVRPAQPMIKLLGAGTEVRSVGRRHRARHRSQLASTAPARSRRRRSMQLAGAGSQVHDTPSLELRTRPVGPLPVAAGSHCRPRRRTGTRLLHRPRRPSRARGRKRSPIGGRRAEHQGERVPGHAR